MNELVNLILQSGRAAIELTVFVLLPMMIVMLTLMRLLEAKGALDQIVAVVAPVLKPLGIPGLGIFALLQTSLVSFAAPLATLVMMDRSAVSLRHIAATLAMVLGAAQANVTFPFSAFGVASVKIMTIAAFASLIGAAMTYHWFGRHLPDDEGIIPSHPPHTKANNTAGTLAVINAAGREALGIAAGALPILLLAMLLIASLRSYGLIDLLEAGLDPALSAVGLPSSILLPALTKYIAGGTAMMGTVVEQLQQQVTTARDIDNAAGFLINSLDLAGVAVLASAGPRVQSVLRPAIYGAICTIIIRTAVFAAVP